MQKQFGIVAMLLAGTWSSGVQAQVAKETGSAQSATPVTPTETGMDVGNAQSDAPEAGDSDSDILVSGKRARGSVRGDIPPERTFNANDIRAFGADDVKALLSAIGAQTASIAGRTDDGPVTLLNGRRISGLSEVAHIPAEAIQRMEILPEAVALEYGYRADQKVVNIVTFKSYRSAIGQGKLGVPTERGRFSGRIGSNFLFIRDDTRIAFGADLSSNGKLLESQRDVRQPSGTPDRGHYRTLLPSTDQQSLYGLISGHVLGDIAATVNGQFERDHARSLLGQGDDGPRRRDTGKTVGHVGATFAGAIDTWEWTALGNYDRSETSTLTDLPTGYGPRDRVYAIDTTATTDLILAGPVFDLPAGPLTATIQSGLGFHDFTGRFGKGTGAVSSRLSRNVRQLQLNIDVPLLNDTSAPHSGIGRLSANFNIETQNLSDAGALWTFGGALNWFPVRAVGFILSGTSEQGAPTLDQLGGPVLATPNVRIYDIARDQVVDVTEVSGGNRDLRNDHRDVVRLGMNLRPFTQKDLTFRFDYVEQHIDHPIIAFPIVSPQIEAEFPDRFVRDATGRLTQIDVRPINLYESRQRKLRWGVSFTKALGAVPPGMADGRIRIPQSQLGQMTQQPDGSFTFQPTPGSAFAQSLTNAASRFYISLYHSWYLEDSLRLRSGQPALDLTNGDAVDVQGGRRRHEIDFQAGVFKQGLGGRLSAHWQSGTEIDGEDGAGDRLRFGDFATVDVSLFANLAERFGGANAPAWVKNTRLTVDVENIFDQRPNVRDATGATPLSYQPAYLDPVGRTISITLRHVF